MQMSPVALVPLLPMPLRGQDLPGGTSKITRLIRINTHTHSIQGVAWEAEVAWVVAMVAEAGVEVGGIAATGVVIENPEGTRVPNRTILPRMLTRRQPRRTKDRAPTVAMATAIETTEAGMRRLTATIRHLRVGCLVHSPRRSR